MNLPNWALFEHLQDEYGLILLESQLNEIITIVRSDCSHDGYDISKHGHECPHCDTPMRNQ